MLVVSLVLFKGVFLYLFVLLGVGFYTLLERKVLGYIQLRKGPNKLFVVGLFQPFADAAKLFVKELPRVSVSNRVFYLLSPSLSLMIVMVVWGVYFSDYGFVSMKLGVLFYLVISSLNVFSLVMAGWSSNSKYSLFGAVRGVAQTISYEISMSLLVICVVLFVVSYDFFVVSVSQFSVWNVLLLFPLVGVWMVIVLAETNRSPFDLMEGESELVSGFNVEYGGGMFAFIFISEYGSMLFMGLITNVFFFGQLVSTLGFVVWFVFYLFVVYLFVWVRGSYPRMRYDYLMGFSWKYCLLFVLSLLFLLYSLVVF